jgi:hypothetical protein
MMTVRARVKNGRLVVDEPTDLPEGTEVELAPVDDDLGDARGLADLAFRARRGPDPGRIFMTVLSNPFGRRTLFSWRGARRRG